MTKVEEIIHGMKTANLPSDYWITPNCVELPELEASKLVTQRNDQSVWDHTMSVIDLLTVENSITLLSGLFHDLGKGCVLQTDDPSLPKFPGHSIESANIARIWLTKWETDPYIVDRVMRLVSTHMFDISNIIQEKTIRKFIANVGMDNIENWFVLRIADSRSYASQQQYRNNFIEPFRKIVVSYIKNQPGPGQPTFDQFGETGSIRIRGGDSK
jgi:hypothetical protein